MSVKIDPSIRSSSPRAGRGAWVQWGGEYGNVIIAYVRGECPSGDWSPYYPASRVRGDSYTPYEGSDEWTKAANAAMKSEANSNFRRGHTH
jgi:hypothetical protein